MTDRAREVLAEEVGAAVSLALAESWLAPLTTDEQRVVGEYVLRYAAEREAAEREACAKIADTRSESEKQAADCAYAAGRPGVCDCRQAGAEVADAIASMIRSRSPEASAPQPMAGWLLIDSAPKDGTDILVLHPGGDCHVVSWLGEGDGSGEGIDWLQTVGSFEHGWDADAFTHWRPLPPTPEVDHRPECEFLNVPHYGVCTCDFDARMFDLIAKKERLVPSQPDTGTKDWRDVPVTADFLFDVLDAMHGAHDTEQETIAQIIERLALQRLSKGKNDGRS